ncbi:sensor histidine kinase [Lentisalinibacter orientalis]|uniref:sensor histidine kinase n=1 Tax=Lentisalinibacter orientalis TaxID=2992241 RepID=UPI003870BFEA
MTSEAKASAGPGTEAAADARRAGLEAVYAALQREVLTLNRQLAEARSERVEQLLEKERLGNRLALLLESLPGAVIVLDGDGIIVECNNRAVELLGRPLIGLTWAEVVDREFGAVRDSAGELRLPDGRWLALSRRSLAPETGEILLLTDVTETRRLQETAERQSRLSSMGEMTARLAHQIRTPLASALLYVSQIEQGATEPALTRRFAGRAIAKLRELEQMINDMVVFAGGGRGPAERFPVAGLLEDVAEAAAAHTPGDAEAAVVTVVMAEPGLTMSGNRPALAGALSNLVQNALQMAGDAARVELGAARTDAGEIWLTVTDNGPGVDESLRDRIFEPFFTTRRQGTGLGLAVVRSVAGAHGGSVSVENHGDGATFLLRLPAVADQPLLASRTAFARAGEAAAAGARRQPEFRSNP